MKLHHGLLSIACLFFGIVLGDEREEQDGRARLIELHKKWGMDYAFSGIMTYAHLPHVRCLVSPDVKFDIGIVGVPFDTAVTYRTGARFGPRAIRAASARQNSFRGFNFRAGINPYASWARLLDCGDIPVSPFDNALALTQMSEGFIELLNRETAASLPLPWESSTSNIESSGRARPVLLALGGDHSIALPHLRALRLAYGESITVVHFDAHLDTWDPRPSYGGGDTPFGPSPQSEFTHGSMFWLAAAEGLVSNYSTHLGLRTRLSGTDFGDYEADSSQGWRRFDVDAIDDYSDGPKGLAAEVVRYIGTERPVYLSIDIDVLDPGLAPGTGTPEPGGWTTRELVKVLRGLEGLNVVGADVVEVSPSFDGAGEETALAAAQVCYEILTSLVGRGRDGKGHNSEEEPVKKEQAEADKDNIKDEL